MTEILRKLEVLIEVGAAQTCIVLSTLDLHIEAKNIEQCFWELAIKIEEIVKECSTEKDITLLSQPARRFKRFFGI
jgi:hypothetical protein